jgi:hypothetical protein
MRRVCAETVFWRILIIAVVVLFLVMWVRAVLDLVRRPDLSVGAKVGWAIGMLILPFIGLLIYTMLRPGDSQIAQRRRT